jgi:hypothetical protein
MDHLCNSHSVLRIQCLKETRNAIKTAAKAAMSVITLNSGRLLLKNVIEL